MVSLVARPEDNPRFDKARKQGYEVRQNEVKDRKGNKKVRAYLVKDNEIYRPVGSPDSTSLIQSGSYEVTNTTSPVTNTMTTDTSSNVSYVAPTRSVGVPNITKGISQSQSYSDVRFLPLLLPEEANAQGGGFDSNNFAQGQPVLLTRKQSPYKEDVPFAITSGTRNDTKFYSVAEQKEQARVIRRNDELRIQEEKMTNFESTEKSFKEQGFYGSFGTNLAYLETKKEEYLDKPNQLKSAPALAAIGFGSAFLSTVARPDKAALQLGKQAVMTGTGYAPITILGAGNIGSELSTSFIKNPAGTTGELAAGAVLGEGAFRTGRLGYKGFVAFNPEFAPRTQQTTRSSSGYLRSPKEFIADINPFKSKLDKPQTSLSSPQEVFGKGYDNTIGRMGRAGKERLDLFIDQPKPIQPNRHGVKSPEFVVDLGKRQLMAEQGYGIKNIYNKKGKIVGEKYTKLRDTTYKETSKNSVPEGFKLKYKTKEMSVYKDARGRTFNTWNKKGSYQGGQSEFKYLDEFSDTMNTGSFSSESELSNVLGRSRKRRVALYDDIIRSPTRTPIPLSGVGSILGVNSNQRFTSMGAARLDSFTRSDTKDRTNYGLFSGISTRQRINVDTKITPKLDTGLKTGLALGLGTIGLTSQLRIQDTTTVPRTPYKPKKEEFDLDGGFGGDTFGAFRYPRRKKGSGGGKRSYRYTPSFLAILTGYKGRGKQKLYTGGEIRGL